MGGVLAPSSAANCVSNAPRWLVVWSIKHWTVELLSPFSQSRLLAVVMLSYNRTKTNTHAYKSLLLLLLCSVLCEVPYESVATLVATIACIDSTSAPKKWTRDVQSERSASHRRPPFPVLAKRRAKQAPQHVRSDSSTASQEQTLYHLWSLQSCIHRNHSTATRQRRTAAHQAKSERH